MWREEHNHFDFLKITFKLYYDDDADQRQFYNTTMMIALRPSVLTIDRDVYQAGACMLAYTQLHTPPSLDLFVCMVVADAVGCRRATCLASPFLHARDPCSPHDPGSGLPLRAAPSKDAAFDETS